MPSTKCEGLSYPCHFLKSRVVLLEIIFLNTDLTKLHFLRDERVFMHCSLQIKQNIYSIGTFRAPVVTQFIVKVLIKIEKKVPFLKVYLFSFTCSKHFLNVKV